MAEDRVEISRDLLQECRNEIANTIDDIGGCDHQVNICCCNLYNLLQSLDDALTEANTTKEP